MEKRRKHILVVDDDPGVRIVLQTLLDSNGYTCDAAKNGEIALTMFHTGHYDALLLAYNMMPGNNSLTILRRIRRRFPYLPGVMITGKAGQEWQECRLVY